ncbi:ETAA1 protein, partial [Eudromia elegans]|nr:ETAA1 protein [Eudromia elegans]
ETPKRPLRRRPRGAAFSSPAGDAEAQQEIFWDPQSPVCAAGDGSGKKKQIASRRAVEISEIVNRIAPQDEKSAYSGGSLLGTWIGEDAIPCTPGVVKLRARTKLSDLKIKDPEEELMKLAKEFDKNLVEFDAAQEQEKFCQVFIQSASETLPNGKDDVQKNLNSVLDEVSEADIAVSLKAVGQSTGIAAAEPCQSSSQKSIDLEAEIALHALFDCSTQKCSGQLSQGLSGISLNNGFQENKSILEEDHLPEPVKNKQNVTSERCQKDTPCLPGSVNQTLPKPHTFLLTKQNPLKTKVVVCSKAADVIYDDFDDWDADFLADDSFVMQITQNPELINTEEASAVPANPPVLGLSDASRTKEQKTSKAQSASLHGKRDIKPDKINAAWKSAQNNEFIPVSRQSQVKNASETIPPPLPFPSRSNANRPQTEKSGNAAHTICCQPSNISANRKRNDLTKVVSQANVGHLNQAEIPKKTPLSFDWTEPKFSDEVLDMFCESDSLWDANCEDDELLYQVCDDIEKQTRSQDAKQGNERAGSTEGAGVNSRSNADNVSTGSKQGLGDRLFAQKTNVKQAPGPLSAAGRSSSKVARGLAAAADTGSCRSVSGPITVVSSAPVECKYALPKNCHQAASGDTAKTISGKWYRWNSIPAGKTASEGSPANVGNAFSSKASDSLLCNTGRTLHSSSGNKTSLVPSKFKFRKTNSAQGALCVESANPECRSGSGITVPRLEESNNQLNTTLHSKPESTKLPFKRHLSESFALPTAGSAVEQKNRKCSQEEIERKKQEALARRKSRMQASLKDV